MKRSNTSFKFSDWRTISIITAIPQWSGRPLHKWFIGVIPWLGGVRLGTHNGSGIAVTFQ